MGDEYVDSSNKQNSISEIKTDIDIDHLPDNSPETGLPEDDLPDDDISDDELSEDDFPAIDASLPDSNTQSESSALISKKKSSLIEMLDLREVVRVFCAFVLFCCQFLFFLFNCIFLVDIFYIYTASRNE